MTHLPRLLRTLLMGVALVSFSAPTAAFGQQLTDFEQLARDILEELVEINTAHSAQGTLQAAEAMATRLRAAGFEEEDLDISVVAPGEGNVVARLRGRDTGRKPILLLAHIDVVEADPADWTLPPFEFIEQDSTFYGRGVADDKDEAAIYTAILIKMKQEGFVPDRDIIMALTADEEGGGHNGVAWLLENRRELIDAEFALNEGGGGVVVDGQKVSNAVQASEKKFQNFTLEATNPGGHRTAVGAFKLPVNLNEVTTAFFTRSADIVDDPEVADAMRRIVADQTDAEAAAVLSKDPRYNSMMRTSCVATLLDGGHASNALPQRATANVNCRILPDESPADIRDALQRAVGNPNVTVTAQGQARNSVSSPLTPELLQTIERVTDEMWPGLPVVPTMSTGATDGLMLRNAGIPVYGASGLFYGETFLHGMNERIPVRAFYEGLEFLDRLVRALSTGEIS